MLSYRHAFHAGNYADVLKHIVLTNSLHYMRQKNAAILYIDSHAGAGQYDLGSAMAAKTGEHQHGISQLDFAALPPSIAPYRDLIQPALARHVYPGSPAIAAQLLRAQDRLQLFELHPSDHRALAKLFARDRRVSVAQIDAPSQIKALLPAAQKRALLLMDPSYEIKTEYQQVARSVALAWTRMPQAVILLWYPVVQRRQTEDMIRALQRSGISKLWRYELAVAEDREPGMSASGMLAINPPWVLEQQLAELLPALVAQLAPQSGSYRIENLHR